MNNSVAQALFSVITAIINVQSLNGNTKYDRC